MSCLWQNIQVSNVWTQVIITVVFIIHRNLECILWSPFLSFVFAKCRTIQIERWFIVTGTVFLDSKMRQRCFRCHDWYHPECLFLCRGQVEAAKCKTSPYFLCPYCLAANRKPSKVPRERPPCPEFSLSKPCFNPAFAR